MQNNEGSVGKSRKVLALLFLAIVCVILLCASYIAFKPSPKKVFNKAIDVVLKDAKKGMDQNLDKLSSTIDLKMNLETDDEEVNEYLALLNKLNLKIKVDEDLKAKFIGMNLDAKYNNKDLINLDIYAKNNDGYVYLKDYYSKYIHVPIDGMDEIFSKSSNYINDFYTIYTEFFNALDSSLKDEYFTSSKTEITLNNKKQSVTKNSLLINKENGGKLIKDLVNNLKENEEFIKAISKVSETSESEIKEMLTSIIEEEFDLEENENVTVSIYTKGIKNEFVGITVESQEDQLVILKDTDTNYSYELTVTDTNGKENIKGTVSIETKKDKSDIHFTIDSKEIKGSVDLSIEVQYNKTIEQPNISPVVELEEMDDDELEKISEKFQKNEAIMELSETFSDIFEDIF